MGENAQNIFKCETEAKSESHKFLATCRGCPCFSYSFLGKIAMMDGSGARRRLFFFFQAKTKMVIKLSCAHYPTPLEAGT